jgi:creatinine amidohydrolase
VVYWVAACSAAFLATTNKAALWRAAFVGVCCCLAAAVQAAPPTVFLEELTWVELRDRIAAGSRIAIVPIGGTEQNGPHISLGKHNARVKVLAERIADKLGNAIVAPVLAYVPEGSIEPPRAHMRWPGTISVPEAAFEAVLEGAARSLLHAGFSDVVLLGDHGGYRASLDRVAARLPHVHALPEYYRAATAGHAQALRERGFATAEIGSHAGLADTALTLATDPASVRLPLAQSRAPSAAGDGVEGDPRRASVELGRIGADLIVQTTVAAIQAKTSRAAQSSPRP